MKQTTFVSLAFEQKKKQTRRERFLAEVESIRRFAGLDLTNDTLPDETTTLKFRHPLEKHGLTGQMVNIINDTLVARGLLLKGGTMIDANAILAPHSTKNQNRKRDPEMHQTKKGEQWHFGMKIHVGADVNSGLVHRTSLTPANAPDFGELPRLLREDDQAVFGDKGCVINTFKRPARTASALWGVSLQASKQRPLTEANKRLTHKTSSIRAHVEHVFRVIKRQFGYTKVRDKGLVKNAAQVFSLIGLTNLYSAGRALMN